MGVEALDLAEFLDEGKRGAEGFFIEHHHARAALELVGGQARKGMARAASGEFVASAAIRLGTK